MNKITAKALKGILENPGLWLSGKIGKRADLRGADLREVALQSINLEGRSENISLMKRFQKWILRL